MTIKDYPSELAAIEKKFYVSTLSQITTLAKKGDFVNAYKFIERADLLDGIKKKIFDEVTKIQIMHGMPLEYVDDNPYEASAEWLYEPGPKKKSAPRRKKKRSRGRK
jgi:hypothetical protein|tara:strand:- start:131 stop:451 length:321 start_codon:yes stop_codon:yes gene_type:complete